MKAKGTLHQNVCRLIRACGCTLLFFAVYGHAQQASQKLHKHVPSVVKDGQAKLIGPVQLAKKVQMTIVLPVRNQAGLTALLGELYNPSSPIYRHFLSVQQFTDQFGPTEQNYEQVIQWATKNGFTISRKSENHLTLSISGTAGQVNKTLNVSMNVYRDPNGKGTFYSIDREPTLDLNVPIAHIEGLNNFSIPHPMVKRKKNASPVADVTGSGPGGYYLGSDMRAAYYGGTLLTGTGQCVGLLEFGGYRLSDVNLTFNNAGQSYSVPINNVLIDGATAVAGTDDSEQVLDIVQAIGMAPGLSQVRVYIGNGGYDADIFNAMATENACKQLSVSWSWVPADPGSDDGIFQELAAQGQSVFVASGDSGAYDASVSPYYFPAEDAYVTAVGGTHLTTEYGGSAWSAETAWNNPPYGSGGGISPDNIPIPSWQQGFANYPNAGSSSLRNVPDVAMEADLDNYSCDMGSCAGGIGGTSFAAPRWAAFMALINQQATEAGTAPSGGLGFINPAIYSIGAGSNYGTDIHDISSGNNDTADQLVWYNAVAGYDLVTGWGSPNGQNFIDALAGPVIPGFWLSSSPASLSVSQSSSATATVSVIGAGGFSGNVSLTASGLPAGVTASFNPTSTVGTSELTLTASSTASLGTATVTITGTSGGLISTTSLFLTVNSPAISPPPAGGFGSVNVGSVSQPTPLNLTFATAGTLGSVAVLTQGIQNLDFTDAGGGSCAIGTAYAANATCTVNVTFAPRYAGTRYGAVVLTDASGNQLTKLYLQGSGVGPQATFAPGSQTTVGSGFISPEDVAMLGDGSLYVADYGNGSGTGAVYFEQFSNAAYAQSKLTCTFATPTGIAVDGSGTIYVADPGARSVYKVTVANGTCSSTAIGTGFAKPWSVAVDGSGDIYITDLSAAVYKETLQANGSYVQSTVGSGWIEPTAVAVDGSGNIAIADYAVPGVFVETPSGGSYTQSAVGAGWTAPSGIAFDESGNLYVVDAGNAHQYEGSLPATVFKEARSGGSYVQTQIGSGWDIPYGITADASGNIYVADETRGVYKEDFADPPALGFANAPAGSASTDSPKSATISNIGTGTLQFSAVTYATDFPEAAGVPTDCTATTSLAAGDSCTLSIEFLPTTALGMNTSLALNESVMVTTNTLNTGATQQGLQVSGTEVLPTGTVSLNVSSDPVTAGTPLTLTATVGAVNGGPAPTGSFIFYDGETPITGSLALSDGVATYSTSALGLGAHTIFAAYSGDSNYLGSNSNTITESVIAAPGTSAFGGNNFGAQNIGTSSAVTPLSITFTTAETLGGIAVLTEGVPNLDFVNAGGGTCSIGTAYAANANCTVNVTFTPKYSGTRKGAVVLSDNSGNVIGTGYLEGTGVGAQTAFLPGAFSQQNVYYRYPQGIAVDGGAHLYIAEAISHAVYNGNGSLVIGGFSEPYGTAVDAAGNLYVADVGAHTVYKETPSNGSYIQTVIGYGFISPSGVAVDALGNVYVADFGNGVTPGALYVETFSNGSYKQSTIGSGFVTPQAVAVDGSGNIYVGDAGNGNEGGTVYKLVPSGGSYTQTPIGSGWVTPTGIAVDGNGNIYVTDNAYGLGNGFIFKEMLQADGSYVQSTLLTTASIPYPGGVAVDGRGNLYFTDDFDGLVYSDDLADPSAQSFAATMFGATSSDSPRTVTVQNAGNSNLAFSSVSYPIDFPEAPGIASDCTSQSSLAPGSTCTLTANFEPNTPLGGGQPKALAENVTITTNSFGSSTQNLAVSGTEATPTITVALTTEANLYAVGSTVTFTATVRGQSGFPVPTGTVTFYSTINSNPPTQLSTAQLDANGTAIYSTASLSASIYDISATYSGDSNYPGATSTSVIVTIIPASGPGIANIGSSTSSVVTFSFSSRTTLGSIAVLTDGQPNLDFTDGGGGTCSVGTAYKSNSSCTVNISFTPKASGARHGAVVIGDKNGNLLQTIYLEGTGVGPQPAFQPASATTIITLQSAPCAQAVDYEGDIYVISSHNGACGPITKWTPSSGSYTQSLVSSSTLSSQVTIAADGAGNVYVADTGNGRVLKETFFGGTYTESVLASGLAIPRAIAVDGNGVVYFFVAEGNGTNPQYQPIYEETPSSSGGYVQTSTSYGLVTYGTEMAVDDQGNIFIKDHDELCCYYFQDDIAESIAGNHNQPIKLDFMDPNGNLYATIDQQILKFTRTSADSWWTSGGWIWSCSSVQLFTKPTGPCSPAMTVPNNVWGVDGYGNFYGLVDTTITIVKSAAPTTLRFAETNVGSTSSDSPKTFTLLNVGNAPLTFSVPGTGSNPSVSSNFSLDPSTSCPQISTSGTASSLPVNNSCTYAVNFVPTDSGTIDGSLVMSDNALNAVNGTQTVPLFGAGDVKSQIAILTVGRGGSPQVRWVPNGSSLNPSSPSANGDGIWTDTYSPTLIVGFAEFQTDQNGNATCTEIGAGSLSVASDVLGGIITPGQGRFALPNGVCPGHVYDWATATYTWGANTSDLQDPFTLDWTESGGQNGGTFSGNAEYTPITVTAATQSGPNAPITATASLTNPVPYAKGYTWNIIGGGGAIVFPNGQEKMGSTDSITIEEPNPTGTSVPFSLQVEAEIQDTKPLTYGPTQKAFGGLSCSPSSVTRGSTTTCTASGPSGSLFSGWQFSDGTNTVNGTETSSTWSGTMVTSGTVSVTVTYNGVMSTVSANVAVTPRTGFAFTAVQPSQEQNPYTCVSGTPPNQTTLTLSVDNPPVLAQANTDETIGQYCDIEDYSYNFATIADGPNQGYSYITQAFNNASFHWIIAQDVQDTSSAFYQAQCGNYNATNNSGFLSGNQLNTNTVRHESGTEENESGTPEGHYGKYLQTQAEPSNNIGTGLESAVNFSTGQTFQSWVSSYIAPRVTALKNGTHYPEPYEVNYDQNGVYDGPINFSPYVPCQ